MVLLQNVSTSGVCLSYFKARWGRLLGMVSLDSQAQNGRPQAFETLTPIVPTVPFSGVAESFRTSESPPHSHVEISPDFPKLGSFRKAPPARTVLSARRT